MEKIINAFRIYYMLKSRGKVSGRTIEEELKIDRRTVRSYISDLYEAGIEISSTKGMHGGYEIVNDDDYLSTSITDEEYIALCDAELFLKDSDFHYSREISFLLDKLKSRRKEIEQIEKGGVSYLREIKITDKVRELDRKYLKVLKEALVNREKVVIDYAALSSGNGSRVVRPYAVFQFNGAYYFIGLCEKREEIREFKLCRIQKISILKESYVIPKDFSLKNYIDNSIGIFSGENIHVKIRISHPMGQIIREQIIVPNQKITNLFNEDILFEANMKGKVEIKRWILSLGFNAEVIEPLDLKNEIVGELEKVLEKYK